MTARRWLILILGVVVIAITTTYLAVPGLVRRAAIARIHALTQRPVSIERVELDVVSGRATIHGFRLDERDGRPFADFRRLDVGLRLPALLRGHLWLSDLRLTDSTVRVVRLSTGEFNLSDLVRHSESTGRRLDVTVDHFTLDGGTVTLEDRTLPEPRTWTSEQIRIEGTNLSTRRDDGRAVGRSVTGGAPVAVEVTALRLYPIHLQATVTVDNLDLAPAQVYVPPDAPVVLDRGRTTTTITIGLDARDGVRLDATSRIEDVVLVRRETGQPVVRVPRLTTQVAGLGVGNGGDLQLAQLALDGTVDVRDPRPTANARFRSSSIRASIADLTWPPTRPGQLDARLSIPGGGTVAVAGAIQPPPAPSQLSLRVADLDVAAWTQLLPLAARVTGVAQADLRLNEALSVGIPARVQGSIAITRLGVADGNQPLLTARRVEASGLEVDWPSRVLVNRVLIDGVRGTVERDRTGVITAQRLARPASASAEPPSGGEPPARAAATMLEVGEVVLRDGAMTWRDETRAPAARLDVSALGGRVTGLAWPLRGPAGIRLALRPPGGGQLELTGKIGLDPLWADVRAVARNADLAPYQPYLPTTARIGGTANLDLAVTVPPLAEGRATARGSAALSRVSVRDGQRTIVRIERAQATGVGIDWPEHIAVDRLSLAQPWVLVERADDGTLALHRLLAPGAQAGGAAPAAATVGNDQPRAAPDVTVDQVSMDGGGVRVVDHAVSPAFAIDVQPITLRLQGLSTVSARPARIDARGELGPGADLTVRGTLGVLHGPPQLDLAAEIHEFAVSRANPYVLQQAGWKATEGRLTSSVRAKVEQEELSATADIRVNRLQLVHAVPEDGAQARIGLPLNTLTALLKDRHGDIRLSLPVGGRLSDPRFDLSEVVWSAIRTVAVRAITLPVAWIGRVHFTDDSRIERIEVDPIVFEPGAATLTPEGQAQATRLAAFLDQLPEVRMAPTVVVSTQDAVALKQRAVEASIERLVRESRLSREAAAARLFETAFSGRPAPDSLDSTLGALVERQSLPASAVRDLGAQRLEAVRAVLARAGIDAARLGEATVAQHEPGGRIELTVLPPETERPSRIREVLRQLGTRLKD